MTEPEEELRLTLAGHVWESVRRFPGYPALEKGEREFTYKDLYRRASVIAQAIIDLEDPNPYVAVMADKSIACYCGILGILMAGKAYLPLNPRYPPSRNLYALEKARIRVILAGENSDEELDQILENYSSEIYIIFPDEMDESVADAGFVPKIADPEHPAYLLFTSGTTGTPKGVPVTNRNVTAYLDHMLEAFDFGTDDRFTQVFDLTFDLSVHDMFLAWSCGACLVVPEENSSFAMSKFIREKEPTVWFSVPSMAVLMNKMRLLKPDAFPSPRLSFFCGEALQVKTALAWKNAASGSRIVNLYGPTEATIAITKYILPEDSDQWKSELGIVSIGRIFPGHAGIIQWNSDVPVQGELCLSGSQVVNRYLDNEEADRNSFYIDPESMVKFYKTGDIVRADAESDLFFLGRKDSEVKISGYRVNLKEIEIVLERYETVKQAVVIYEQDDGPAGIIIAFLESSYEDKIKLEKDLDEFCRKYLPWYMVPGKYIFVDEIPLNSNGKTDKTALKLKYYDGK